MAAKKKTTTKKPVNSWGGKKAWTPPVIIKKPRYYPPDNKWLPQFQNVFDFVVNGKGHGSVNAVAGSGKTTCLVEIAYRYKEAFPFNTVVAVAFNKSIREELMTRLPEGSLSHTCHSAGFKSVCRVWGNGKAFGFDLQGSKGFYVQSLAEGALGSGKEKEDDRDALMQTVSLSKTRLAESIDEVIEVMDCWNIDTTYPKEEFAKHVISIMDHMKKQPGVGADYKMAITYDDQVWLPTVNNWAPNELFDLVLIDEGQDLSPARTAIAKSLLKPGGRIIVAGDKNQAIYGWAGADIHALPNIIKELNATELPLTCSFRCAKAIVREAQKYNPIITAAPNAPEGKVETISPKEMVSLVKAGDAILSRTNAPLIRIFFRLAKQGTKVRMLGRDFAVSIGTRVKSWQKKAKKANQKFTGDDLLDKNSEWLDEQVKYLKRKKLSIDRAVDEADTISSLCDDLDVNLSSEAAVKEVIERINTIFSADEEPGGTDGKSCVTLSTTHKFKGLERPRIFLLWDTYCFGDSEEELNVKYVSVSRAKTHLYYIRGKFNN